MGLDVYLYGGEEEYEDEGEQFAAEPGEEEDQMLALIQHAMRLAKVQATEVRLDGFSEDEHYDMGRGYCLRLIADHARDENLAMPHTTHLTASQWEVILPVPFDAPVPMFPGGEADLQARGLPPRDAKWDNPGEAIAEFTRDLRQQMWGDLREMMGGAGEGEDDGEEPQVIFGLGSVGGSYGFPGYLAYYLGTPAEDIHCLSAAHIHREVVEWLIGMGILKKPEGAESWSVDREHPDINDDTVHAALTTCHYMQEALRLKRVMLYSG